MKVKKVAKQRTLQAQRRYTRRYCVDLFTFWWIDANEQQQWLATYDHPDARKNPYPESALDTPIPRPRALPDSHERVSVYVQLRYPLTEHVPEEARESNFEATTVKEVCLEIRRLYEAIYAEDDRRGGPVDVGLNGLLDPLSHDIEHKTILGHKLACHRIRNRGFGPWVWGHDMSDLAIEVLGFHWISPTHVHVDVAVGS
jgi:hypothetical protein